MNHRQIRALALCACSLLVACASGRPSRPASNFPKPEALGRLQARVRPTVSTPAAKRVERWQLAGPFPQTLVPAPHRAASAWEQLLEATLASVGSKRTATEALHCAAREIGRFHAKHDAYPAEELRAFIERRCASAAHVRLQSYGGDAPAEVTEAALLGAWRNDVAKLFAERAKGAGEIGAWFGRDGPRAVLVVATAEPKVRVEEGHVAPGADGSVVLRGEVLVDAKTVGAKVTRGRFGFADCVLDEAVALPRFVVRCPVAPEDESALVSVVAWPPKRLLGEHVAELLASPRGRPADLFVERAEVESVRSDGSAQVREQFAGLVNGVRRRAGLQPVVLAERQSATAAGVAPHFFAAMFGDADEEDADLITLGLMAGWEVDGVVRVGRVSSSILVGTNDLGRLLSFMLASPYGRETLLSPNTRQLAVGDLWGRGEAHIGALVGTYEMLDDAPLDALTERAYEKLNQQRRRAGRKNAKRVVQLLEPAKSAAALVHARRLDPWGGRQQLHEDTLARMARGSFASWYAEVESIDELEFPQEMIDADVLGVALAVAQYRYEDEPWARLVVLVVAIDKSALNLAAAVPDRPFARGAR